jgi:hypothetical protein
MNGEAEDERAEDEAEPEVVDRDEWLAQEVDASWTHLGGGDLCAGPTASWCDVYARREEDGSFTLRFFGEGLEPSDPPEELEAESCATADEAVALLAERGLEVDAEDLPGATEIDEAAE